MHSLKMLTKNEQRNGFRDLEAIPIVCGILIMITARENIPIFKVEQW